MSVKESKVEKTATNYSEALSTKNMTVDSNICKIGKISL